MKKIIIFLVLILIAISLLPIIGNKVVDEEVKNRLTVLTSYGVEIKTNSNSSSYLTTQKHYELKVIDSDKFVSYLQQFSDKQFPPYINSMLQGVIIGSDIKYSNLFFNDAVGVEIYPLSLSKKFMNFIQNEDKQLNNYIQNILQTKGILYHIDYNVLRSDFNGYIKDIDEKYILQDGTKVSLNLQDSTFTGKGLLIAPQRIDSTIKNFAFNIIRLNEEVKIVLKDWDSSSNFESASTYAHATNIRSFYLKARGTIMGDLALDLQKVYIDFSSNTQSNKAQFYTKTSFESLNLLQNKSKIRLERFNYDMALKNIDKDSFEKLRVLLIQQKISNSKPLANDIQTAMIDIISKGLNILIADFSIKKLDYKKYKNMDGFSIKSDLALKEDLNLVKNINFNPNKVIKNLDINTSIKISKQMFNAIEKEVPMVMLIKGYSKEQGENMVFNFLLQDGIFSINGKVIR